MIDDPFAEIKNHQAKANAQRDGWPEDAVDVCYVSVAIKLGARDRVKALLGATIHTRVEVASRTFIEKCGSRADTSVRLPFVERVRSLFSRVAPETWAAEAREA